MLHIDAQEQEVIECLQQANVSFVVIGGAAAQHYLPERTRNDLDFFIDQNQDNATRLARALSKWVMLAESDIKQLSKPNTQLPFQIMWCHFDFLTSLPGLSFEEAINQASIVEIAHLRVPVLSFAHLLKSKADQSDPKHITDFVALQKL